MKHTSFIMLTLLTCLPSLVPLQARTDKPNLIVIMADDFGYADVGFNGCKDIPTPNIDSIAADGVKFRSGYVG
jgi:arylsulfatase A-like enzyme